MLSYCRKVIELEGLTTQLYEQALHELDAPRRYQTIFACGVFGIGVDRAGDFAGLLRFYEHLLPGGVLLLEHYLPYEDAKTWPLWRKDARFGLPKPWPDGIGIPPKDGGDSEMHYRVVDLDPLEQRNTGQMRMLQFKDGNLMADNTYTLTINLYFRNELRAMIEKAGFTIVGEEADWTDNAVTEDTDVIVFIARK